MNTDRFNHITDQELLDHFYNDHNNEWLGILLQRYTLLLFGVCMKYLKNEEEAKDSVQQIFLKVIPELHKYKVDYFKSWIYMVSRNHCLMKLRNSQGKTSVGLNEQIIVTQEDDLQKKAHIEKDRVLEQMEDALQGLSNEQKLCVTLFYLEKKSYQQITEQTGFTMMQVKSHIQNGKRNLKLMLDKKLNKS
ncbi:MAG: sigma-70 family RNA polymerase sigma factor [Bacteroidetes bacterium]|nr:sigma-70 family RNA polymerase sigma factor [Bacteroidota bacterium]MBS1934241.1 sigma-70 family RNA polymerase sigma factor [Bacteroidota bacterium]